MRRHRSDWSAAQSRAVFRDRFIGRRRIAKIHLPPQSARQHGTNTILPVLASGPER